MKRRHTPALLSVLCAVAQMTHVTANRLHHGGVAMGHINVCDDAKTQIAIDWDPNSSEEYTCNEGRMTSRLEDKSAVTCEDKTKPPIHVCYPTELQYDEVPPTSGQHRPNWADYGEYRYVPPQRWLHDLEHGAVVMLYHPCANPAEVNRLRKVVTGCIRKHVITPYKLLPSDTPFALLTWGCKLTMSRVNRAVAQQFIVEHGLKDGPEGMLARSGLYNQSLIVPARVVSDFDDSILCPDSQMLEDEPGEAKGPWMDEASSGYLDHLPDFPPGALLQHNPIIFQSFRRRQWLDKETERMQNSLRRLQRAYEHLVSE